MRPVIHPRCIECGSAAPLEVGEYTLFGAPFFWRLSRESTHGRVRLVWRCPACAESHRVATASMPPPPRKARPPLVLVLDSQELRREGLAQRLAASARLEVESMAWPELRRLSCVPAVCAIHRDDPLAQVFAKATRTHLPGTWIVGLGPLEGADEVLPIASAERLAWAVLRRATPSVREAGVASRS